MRLTRLPYRVDSADLFETIADEPWSVFLDSGRPHAACGGRFDILSARPFLTLVTRGEVTEIRQAGQITHSGADPFSLLRQHLAVHAGPADAALPFTGGAIGYFGYDLARRIESLPEQPARGAQVPDMAIGFYDWAVLVDHLEQTCWLVGAGRDAATAAQWQSLVALFSAPPAESAAVVRQPFHAGEVNRELTRDAYFSAFARIQRYIHAGDCYQVNLAQRFTARVVGDAWLGYRMLRRINPAPHAAYLNQPEVRVLSSSPERFLEVRAGRVSTRPIKGTRPRSPTPATDAALARELLDSAKDRAENLMIVDLLRNDLGKVCQPGSVETPRLFEIESYASVHHLVSTVTGRLAQDCDAVEVLRAAFPGGSITGAPKLRAMQIIAELEPARRGVYCGAIGWLGFNGDMDSSIAIRTAVTTGDEITFWTGGGIVADSDAAAEYQECFDKAAALLHWLGACHPVEGRL